MDERLSADHEGAGAGSGAGPDSGARRVGKSATAFRTISEVAGELDVPQHVLRFWETRFSQIRPLKRAGGRRYYRPEDVELLRRIREFLYQQGYTIRGVQKLLRDGSLGGGAAAEAEPGTPVSLEPVPAPAPAPLLETVEPASPPARAPAAGAAAAERAAVEAVIAELTALRDLLRLRATPQAAVETEPTGDPAAVRAANARLKELRADTTLDDLSWKAPRDEGRG